METRVDLGELPNGTRIGVTASFGDGLEADGSITVDRASTSKHADDVIYVQLDTDLDLYLNEACHDESPSDEARQGGSIDLGWGLYTCPVPIVHHFCRRNGAYRVADLTLRIRHADSDNTL